MYRRFFPFVVTSLLFGCGGLLGRPEIFTMKDVEVKTASLLVARKIERPLYVVIDATLVKDVVDIEGVSRSTKVKDFHLFIERDLKRALEPYFAKVEVVKSKAALPSTPHIVADVKVDRLRVNDQQAGILMYRILEITWSFAVRPNEADDYLFSYAGTSSSSPTYPDFKAGCAQMVEAAITDMLQKWTESDGIAKLRALSDAPAADAPPATETKPNTDLKKL